MARKIAIDDGHGRWTAGKRTPIIPELGRAIHENEFNEAVANFLNTELKRCGFDTLMVAPTDADDSLNTRVARANRWDADLYVSIHYNAFDGTFAGHNPEGFSIHVYDGHINKAAGKLAKCIEEFMVGGTEQVNRGVKDDDFHVLRETNMTAVLIEHGFMDNPREARLMLNVEFQKECAREIAQGICKYYGIKYVPSKEVVEMANKDVASEWARAAQEWAKEQGVSDGSRPFDNLTRQEAWTMLKNFYEKYLEGK